MNALDWRAVASADMAGMAPVTKRAYLGRRLDVGMRLVELAYRRRTNYMRTRIMAAQLGMRWGLLPKTMPWFYGRLTPWV